jgi:hypothetical protein
VAIDTAIILNKLRTVAMDATDDYEVLGETLVYSDLFKSPEDWSTPGDPQVDPDPTEAAVGDHWKVVVDENLDSAGHYVKTSDGWERCAAPADPDGRADTTSWPHRLVFDPDTETFTFDALPINDRLSGNSVTNPAPHLVGGAIKSAQFLGNRLVFIGEDSVKLTAANDVFTIFNNNVNNITDADPIEKDILITNAGTPLRSEVCGDAVLILCENGVLTYGSASQDQLSAITNEGRLRKIADFKPQDIYPGSDGRRIAFVDQLGQIRLFEWDDQVRTVQYLGCTTEHVQDLFDGFDIEGVWLDGDTTYVTTTSRTVFVHEMYLRDGKLEQSAWATWVFNDRIRYLDTWGDQVRLVSLLVGTSHSLLTFQHRRAQEPEGFDFLPRLDRLEIVTGTYHATDDTTMFRLTGRDASLTETVLVASVNALGETSNEFLVPVRVDGRRFWVQGKWTGANHYAGFRFQYDLTLSKLHPSLTDLRPMYKGKQSVFFADTFSATIEVTREGETVRTIEYPANTLNAKSLNATQKTTGQADFLILGDARNTTIRITDDSPGPLTVSALGINVEMKGRG